MRHRYLVLAAGFGGLAALPAATGCGSDAFPAREGAVQQQAAVGPLSTGSAPAGEERLYQATLRPVGDSAAAGTAEIGVAGDRLRVRIHATGLAPGENIPQHIHVNPGCDPGGAVLLNLDANLTVPGEGPGTGNSYPVASRTGVMHYEASRSLDDLRSALATWGDATLDDTAALLAFLDLADRNIHMHVAFGPPFPAVTCGALGRIQ